MAKEIQFRAHLLLRGENLEIERDRCITINEGIIQSIQTTASCSSTALGGSLVILPEPGLAHVHSGDHLFPEIGVDLDLEKLVAPPDGLKHKLLARSSPEKLVIAIRDYYELAWRLGNGILIDFREGGGVGCSIARKALDQVPEGIRVVILGRPGPEFPLGCDGLGLSSPLDYSLEELKTLVSNYRPAFTHVAETRQSRKRKDLEIAIETGFDALVHGTHLSRRDLEEIENHNIGLILCPRSNLWHGIGIPPVREALRIVRMVALGSDNASWIPPNPWREAEASLLLSRLSGPTGDWLALSILRALFINPYLLVGEKPKIVEEGVSANFIVYSDNGIGLLRSESLYYGLLKRIMTGFIIARVDNGVISYL